MLIFDFDLLTFGFALLTCCFAWLTFGFVSLLWALLSHHFTDMLGISIPLITCDYALADIQCVVLLTFGLALLTFGLALKTTDLVLLTCGFVLLTCDFAGIWLCWHLACSWLC